MLRIISKISHLFLKLGSIFSESCYNGSLVCQATHKNLLTSEHAFNMGSTTYPKYMHNSTSLNKCIQSCNLVTNSSQPLLPGHSSYQTKMRAVEVISRSLATC